MQPRPRFLRMVIAGMPVRCTGLQVDPADHLFELTIDGWNFPDELRGKVDMGSEITVASEREGKEHKDVFSVLEVLGAREDREGRFTLRVRVVHLKKLSG